uniref:Uncharacterized protein n=1 Tax=Anguilla anguilla TaxID=7936 RepID=A0A0E9Q7S5_ANGAN
MILINSAVIFSLISI